MRYELHGEFRSYRSLGNRTSSRWAENQVVIARGFTPTMRNMISRTIEHLIQESPTWRGLIRHYARNFPGQKIEIHIDRSLQNGAYAEDGKVFLSRNLLFDSLIDVRRHNDIVRNVDGEKIPVLLLDFLSHELGHAIGDFNDGLEGVDNYEGSNQIFNTFIGRELSSYRRTKGDTNLISEYAERWGR